MTVTSSSRLGITQWSAGGDPFTRAQMDASHAAIDNLAAIDLQGTAGARPAAGTRGRFYFATDTYERWRDDGSAWRTLPYFDSSGRFAMYSNGLPQFRVEGVDHGTNPQMMLRRRLVADGSTYKELISQVTSVVMSLFARTNAYANNSDISGMDGRWAINWGVDSQPDDTFVIKNATGSEIGRFYESGGGLQLKHVGGSNHITLRPGQTAASGTPALSIPTGDVTVSNGFFNLSSNQVAAGATAGGGAALPATVNNFLRIKIDGTEKKIPYYNV